MTDKELARLIDQFKYIPGGISAVCIISDGEGSPKGFSFDVASYSIGVAEQIAGSIPEDICGKIAHWFAKNGNMAKFTVVTKADKADESKAMRSIYHVKNDGRKLLITQDRVGKTVECCLVLNYDPVLQIITADNKRDITPEFSMVPTIDKSTDQPASKITFSLTIPDEDVYIYTSVMNDPNEYVVTFHESVIDRIRKTSGVYMRHGKWYAKAGTDVSISIEFDTDKEKLPLPITAIRGKSKIPLYMHSSTLVTSGEPTKQDIEYVFTMPVDDVDIVTKLPMVFNAGYNRPGTFHNIMMELDGHLQLINISGWSAAQCGTIDAHAGATIEFIIGMPVGPGNIQIVTAQDAVGNQVEVDVHTATELNADDPYSSWKHSICKFIMPDYPVILCIRYDDPLAYLYEQQSSPNETVVDAHQYDTNKEEVVMNPETITKKLVTVHTFEIPEELAHKLSDLLIKQGIRERLCANNMDDPVKFEQAEALLIPIVAEVDKIKNHITSEYVPAQYRFDQYTWNYLGWDIATNHVDIMELQ